MPGTFVLMGLNSPRTSAGAFGLRSYISMWLGPPASHTRITDLRFAALPLAARAFSKLGRVRPPSASAPTLSIERRLSATSSMGLIPSSFTNPVVATTGLNALLVIKHELARVEDRPEHVLDRALLVLRTVNVLGQAL